MATSGLTHYTVTRADIVKRALRIIGAIGQGETPTADAITEASQALNEIVKEWNADGMQMWKYTVSSAITLVAAQANYSIGISQAVNQTAPTKVTQAWLRNITSSVDTPIILLTSQEYDMLGNKTSAGPPNQLRYQSPGAVASEQVGTITLYPVPDAATAAAYNLYIRGMYSIMDFNAASDTADFPSFYYNALAWGLADQLSYEYGVPFAQQSMITKKAETHKEKAMDFDREEGSIFLQPDWTSGRNW